MNLNNYKAVPLTVLIKHQFYGAGEKVIELISDDHEAVKKCRDAYNQIAELQKCDTVVWTTERIMGYFKRTK